MILFGSYSKSRDLLADLYPMLCSNCTKLTPHGLVSEQKKARLYGIPVAKWGSGYRTVCLVCQHFSPITDEQSQLYVAVHLRGEHVTCPTLDALAKTEAGRLRADQVWSACYEKFAADPTTYINHNLVESEDQVMIMAGFITASLCAAQLDVHPYEAYSYFLSGETTQR